MAIDFLNPLISAISGLGGVFLGGWLTGRHDREKRRGEFVMRQLADFYGPLASLRLQIRARADLRVKLDSALCSIHERDVAEARSYTPDARRQISDETSGMFSTVQKDEDKIFREVVMPMYCSMRDILQQKMWMAEPNTREYVDDFIAFVDVWERHLRGTIPGDLVREIEHGEAKLHPFYKHLEETHDRLQAVLASGK